MNSPASILKIIELAAGLISIALSGYISIKLAKIHRQFNSRMDELVETKVHVAKIEGKEEGRKEEVARVEQKPKEA